MAISVSDIWEHLIVFSGYMLPMMSLNLVYRCSLNQHNGLFEYQADKEGVVDAFSQKRPDEFSEEGGAVVGATGIEPMTSTVSR